MLKKKKKVSIYLVSCMRRSQMMSKLTFPFLAIPKPPIHPLFFKIKFKPTSIFPLIIPQPNAM